MDTFDLFVRNHWKYYITLEEAFLGTEKYVEFDEINYATFSIEYLMLFQTVCSEIDVVGKRLAVLVNDDFKPKNNTTISDWWYQLQSNLKEELQKPVLFYDAIYVNPWDRYSIEEYKDKKRRKRHRLTNKSKTPSWWTAYNKVKHQRSSIENGRSNYTRANLQNVINAFAGLYLLEKTYLQITGDHSRIERIQYSRLFEHEKWTNKEDVRKEIDDWGYELGHAIEREMRLL